MSKKLNIQIKSIDHLQGHNKRQGFAHYTDRDIRSNVLFAPNQCGGGGVIFYISEFGVVRAS